MKKFFTQRLLIGVASLAAFGFIYQNCGAVRFSNIGTINASGTDTCTPSINVAPQLSFIPSTFDAGQAFVIQIASPALYSNISIDFGDNTPVLNVNPSSQATLTYTYAHQGSYTMTTSATESICQTSFSETQTIAVGACVPEAAVIETAITPQVPANPAPVAPLSLTAEVTNSADFQGGANWYINSSGIAEPGGPTITLNLQGGSYVLQAKALDTCGTTQKSAPVSFCVAQSGNPSVSVTPPNLAIGTLTTFTVLQPQSYSSLQIQFGDGGSGKIATTGATAGKITHIYNSAVTETYVVTAIDSCGGQRITNGQVTVSAPSCRPTAPDGCVGINYCTGHTTCNPSGTCNPVCGLCGYSGQPVNPVTSCSTTGNLFCTTGGTTCAPVNNCSATCGQCGFTGNPISPITSCVDGQVCVSGGTTCAPTRICRTVPGQCGVRPPLSSPTPTPPAWPQPSVVPSITPSATPPSGWPQPSALPTVTPTPPGWPQPSAQPSASASPPVVNPTAPPTAPPTNGGGGNGGGCNDCTALCGGSNFVSNSCMIDDATCPYSGSANNGFCTYADSSCACSLGFNQCFCRGGVAIGESCGVNGNCKNGRCVNGVCR